MNNKDKEKISKSTMVLILVLVMVWILGFLICPSISSCVKGILTPRIQKEYYVSPTIYDENGEVAKGITAEEAYIVPLSKAISLLLMMIVIIGIAYFVLRKLYKKGISFRGVSKLVKILEVLVIFLGIFIFVFKLNSIETKYGIYKETLNEETNLSYYQVEELPVAVDYLHNETMNIFEKTQMFLLKNTDKIVWLFEVIIAISGAMALPLEYCVSIEDEKKKLQEYQKIKSDIYSQVTDNVLRKLKKENQL